MTTIVIREGFGKVRLGWVRDAEIAFDPDIIDIRIDGNRLPPASVEYLIMYGIRQTLADSAADTDSREAAIRAVEKRIEALLAGNPPKRGAGGGRTYPAEVKETINVLAEALRKRGLKAKDAMNKAKEAVLGNAEECEGIPVSKAREIALARLEALKGLEL